MVALKLRQLALAAAVANVASLPLHAREGNEPGLPHDDATTSSCSWWADYDGSQTCKELLDWNWIELEDFRRWVSFHILGVILVATDANKRLKEPLHRPRL